MALLKRVHAAVLFLGEPKKDKQTAITAMGIALIGSVHPTVSSSVVYPTIPLEEFMASESGDASAR